MKALLPNPGAMKILVWAYFGFVAGVDGTPANKESSCAECDRTVATKGRQQHIKPASHSTIYSRIKGNTQNVCNQVEVVQTAVGTFVKVTPYVQNGKKEKLTGAVMFCLAKDIMPIYLVEKSGFSATTEEIYWGTLAPVLLPPTLFTSTKKLWGQLQRSCSRTVPHAATALTICPSDCCIAGGL